MPIEFYIGVGTGFTILWLFVILFMKIKKEPESLEVAKLKCEHEKYLQEKEHAHQLEVEKLQMTDRVKVNTTKMNGTYLFTLTAPGWHDQLSSVFACDSKELTDRLHQRYQNFLILKGKQ